jgi:hypothetical protein
VPVAQGVVDYLEPMEVVLFLELYLLLAVDMVGGITIMLAHKAVLLVVVDQHLLVLL